MALTLKLDRVTSVPINEGWHFFSGKLSLDTSYPAGGYTVPKQARFETRFKTFMGVFFEPQENRTLEYTRSTGKLRVWVAAGMEVIPGTNVAFMANIPFFAWGYGVHQ